MEEIEQELRAIADTGLQEILLLTGESRTASSVEYIGEAVKLAAMAATKPRAKVFFSFMVFSFIFLYNSLYGQVRLSRQGRGRTTLRKKPRLLTGSRDLKPWL